MKPATSANTSTIVLRISGRNRQKFFNERFTSDIHPIVRQYVVSKYLRDSSAILYMTNNKDEFRVWMDCLGFRLGGRLDVQLPFAYISPFGVYREYELVEKE